MSLANQKYCNDDFETSCITLWWYFFFYFFFLDNINKTSFLSRRNWSEIYKLYIVLFFIRLFWKIKLRNNVDATICTLRKRINFSVYTKTLMAFRKNRGQTFIFMGEKWSLLKHSSLDIDIKTEWKYFQWHSSNMQIV